MIDLETGTHLLSDTQDHDIIPLISEEDEKAIHKTDLPETLPILALRNTVLFPGVVIPITVGRDRSIRLIKEAKKNDLAIGVVSQKDADVEVPLGDDLNKVGTVARIMKMLRMPDGTNTVILRGERRFTWDSIVGEDPYLKALVSPFGGIEDVPKSKETHRALRSGPSAAAASAGRRTLPASTSPHRRSHPRTLGLRTERRRRTRDPPSCTRRPALAV